MKVSEWLSQRDAWTIYDADKILTDLHENTPCGIIDMGVNEYKLKHYVITYPGDRIVDLYPATADSITKTMEARGLGGTFEPGDTEWFITGYVLAMRLAVLIGERQITKSGRGFILREAIEIIKEYEQRWTTQSSK